MTENKGRKSIDEEELEDEEEEEDSQKDKYLTFQIGKEDFGVAIACVTEIVGIQRITEVPDMPDFVKGVVNLRGRVIPVVDVRTRFKFEPRPYDDRTCVVVVDIQGTAVGLIVDKVNDVLTIPESNVSPPPKVDPKKGFGHYIQGIGRVGEGVKILLDVSNLLFDEEIQQLAETSV